MLRKERKLKYIKCLIKSRKQESERKKREKDQGQQIDYRYKYGR